MPPVFPQSKADTWKFVGTAHKPSRARNLAFLYTSTAILNATAGQEFENQLPPPGARQSAPKVRKVQNVEEGRMGSGNLPGQSS